MPDTFDLALPPGARIVDEPGELYEFFGDAPAVHIYAIADLEEPFWSGSRWCRRDDAVVGLVALPSGEGLACYGVATRDEPGTLALFRELAPVLPSGLLITGPVGLADALRRERRLVWDGPHTRFELVDLAALPPVDRRLVPLGPDDLGEVRTFYDAEPGAAFFAPHMLADDTFVGIRDGDRLVAAAGTHVVSSQRRLAAIGSVLTLGSHRGRGLGRAVTVGVVDRLGDRVDVVGLNVADHNAPARRIYESIGFEAVHPYEEVELA